MEILKKIGHFYNVIEEYFVAALLLVSTLACCYEVVMRYIFISPTKWSEEYIRYMMIWMVFVGISVAAKNPRDLINFDLIYSKLSEKNKLILDVIIYALIFAFCIVCVKYCYAWELKTIQYGGMSTAMRIPNWIPRVIMPISFALLSIRFLIHLITSVLALKNYKGVMMTNTEFKEG